MRFLFLVLFLFKFSLFADIDPNNMDKKKILILSSSGGFGHTAAANTLKSILSDDYCLKVVEPINEMNFYGLTSCEEVFYNYFLKNGWTRSMNFLVNYVAPSVVNTQKRQVEEIIQSHVDQERPDLIISLIPFINLPACRVAKKNELPYLLITTDNDLKNWVIGLDKINHPKFKVTIGSDLCTTKGRLLAKGISEDAILTTGLPLRLDFSCEKNKEDLKKTYCIPENKHTVLLIMGGNGCKSTLEYAKRIMSLKGLGIHLIVCAGRDVALRGELRKIPVADTNSLMIMGFTQKVADLMTISDLIITKPGPGTINEAIAMHIPILVDATSPPLYWEKVNIELLNKSKLGEEIKEYKQIDKKLKKYLTNQNIKAEIKEAYTMVPKNQFHEKIKQVIPNMISNL